MLLQIFGLETCNFREFRGADQADTMIPPEPWQPPQLPQGAMQGQKRLQQAEAAVRRLEKRIAELMPEKRMLELELYGDSVTGTLENRKPLQVPFPVDMLSDPNLPTAVSPASGYLAVRDGTSRTVSTRPRAVAALQPIRGAKPRLPRRMLYEPEAGSVQVELVHGRW